MRRRWRWVFAITIEALAQKFHFARTSISAFNASWDFSHNAIADTIMRADAAHVVAPPARRMPYGHAPVFRKISKHAVPSERYAQFCYEPRKCRFRAGNEDFAEERRFLREGATGG